MRKFRYVAGFVCVCILAIWQPQIVVAQSDQQTLPSETTDSKPIIQDVEGLRLELVQRVQDPGSKEIQFDLIVYAQITSDRVQVNWTVGGVSELLTPESIDLKVVTGKHYVTSAIIKPHGFGVTDVLVSVRSFSAGDARVATAKKSIGSFSSGEVFPVTFEYRMLQALGIIRTLAIIAVVGMVGFWIGRIAYAKFQLWLHREDEVAL